MRVLALLAPAVLIALYAAAPVRAPVNVTVYWEPGRYGGWPANHGIWRWGNEIVVGFTETTYVENVKGHVNSKDLAYDRQARSLDGGITWHVEPMRTLTPFQKGGAEARTLTEGMDFAAPDFALMFRFGDNSKGPSWFYYSTDRCRKWKGPFSFPSLGQKGISARSEYLVVDNQRLLLFASAAKANGREGRPLMARTEDGGVSWKLVSWIAPEPEGYAIMPSTVRISPTELFTAVRRKEGGAAWIETYRSTDSGASWKYESRAAPTTGVGSNPPALIRLADGRLCLMSGYRGVPYSIRARLSADNGKSWGPEIILRQDGTDTDLGYVRAT
ncbi:MAG: glycoside hydrolase, partial [Acidobacteriota bacterium]|nr:glycoside hydrolase [Acidobacteriota bacterium]